MLGLQFCIGATNDLVDRDLDRRTKPWKPIPAGPDQRAALPGPSRWPPGRIGLALGAGSLTDRRHAGAGDARLRPCLRPGSQADSVGVGLLLARVRAAAHLRLVWSRRRRCLRVPSCSLPLAAVAGPALQLAERAGGPRTDRDAGLTTLATRLGRGDRWPSSAVLLAAVHGSGLAVARCSTLAPISVLLVVGYGCWRWPAWPFQSRRADAGREAGWSAPGGRDRVLGVGWLAAVG